MAIRAALIFNNHGKPRLTRFYSQLPTSRQQALLQRTFALVHKRTSQGTTSSGREVCNFLDAPSLTPLLPPPARRGSSGGGTATDVSSGGAAGYDETYDAPSSSSKRKSEASNPKQRRNSPNNGKQLQADDQLRVIYRHYATLYFVLIVDESESELGILDLIQVFVEALDRSFENVCELDLIFHFDEVHAILNEIIQGGLVMETNIGEIAQSAQVAAKARKASVSASAMALPAGSASAGASSGAGLNGGGSGGGVGWTPVAGLGGMPWGDAAANVGGWAREWGARIGGGGAHAPDYRGVGPSSGLRY